MANTQTHRPMAVTTPLGPDKLLLVGFSGVEGVSQLFTFRLDVIDDNKSEVPFDKLLGQPVGVVLELPEGKKRYFAGICSRVSQGESTQMFTDYRLEVVPALWLLTRRAQSRIFQHKNVPDILKEVLKGLDVSFQLQGTFHARDFCVQYRETDFNFASRLMEEEGIFYFFTHSDKGHQMVVANTPSAHPDLPVSSKIVYRNLNQGAALPEDVIYDWCKMQELASGKYTLWDHCFEIPHKHLEADKAMLDSVPVGQATHKLKLSENGKLEVYDWPGEYAQRFDGIDRGGGERPAELKKIFEDNKRTVEIRMQEGAAASIVVQGASNCRQMVSGHKFTVTTLPADPLTKPQKAEGGYVLTGVTHSARVGSEYRAGDWSGFEYTNSFTAIPAALPFRPARTAPKPVVPGSQTAVVVGPAGEEIFTDKYSRIKVQFHWDREGKNDADSSCWVRVGTVWAGKQWGVIHIPRIGQEVIVDFLEGDPDQPIVVGSVYNAEMMPPYKLPDNKTQSGVKSRSSLAGTPANFNEFRFEDKKGSEQVFLHAEKNQDIEVENDETHWVGHDRKKTIDHDETTHVKHDRDEKVGNNETILIQANRTETVDKDEKITIHGNRTETVDKDEKITIHGNRTETVDKDEKITISGSRTENVSKDESITIGGGRTENVSKDESITIGGGRTESVSKTESVSVGEDRSHSVTKNDSLDVGKVLAITAGDSITLTTGKASITMKKDGTIVIKGKDITVEGSGQITGRASKDMVLKGKKIHEN